MPSKELVGLDGSAILPPVPFIIVHKPAPLIGVLAAVWLVLICLLVWPAFAIVGDGKKVMFTSSKESPHMVEIVHLKLYELPSIPKIHWMDHTHY